LKSNTKEILVFRSTEDDKYLEEYLKVYVKRRASQKIETRVISSKKETMAKMLEDKKLNKKRKYVPESLFSLQTEIDIYNDRTAFISFGKQLTGIVIENPQVAQSLRTIFELVWTKTKA
jgi:hypothetical protein